MLNVQPDVYAVGSGQGVWAGRDAPAPTGWSTASTAAGSVTSNVWTPGRDANGYITQTSVDDLPANEWVQVAGTQLANLVAAIEATGFSYATDEWSSGKDIRRAISAWVGGADDGRRLLIPTTGGHEDGSMNGAVHLDLLRMQWGVDAAPSLPDAPGFEWDAGYDIPPNGTFTNYKSAGEPTGDSVDPGNASIVADTDGIYRDRLPDDTPTARHSYNGVWYDSTRGEVGFGRISKWSLNRQTGQWTRQRWTVNGGAATRFSQAQELHYHAGNDALYGHFRTTEFATGGFHKCAFPGSNATSIVSTGWDCRAGQSVRLDADRVLFFWYTGGAAKTENAAIFHMGEEQWYRWNGSAWVPRGSDSIAVAVTDGVPFNTTFGDDATMQPCVYVPTWGAAGQVIRAQHNGSGGWWIYDIATHSNVPYTPAGVVPVPLQPGSKWRTFQNLGLALMLSDRQTIATSVPAVYVMRYA